VSNEVDDDENEALAPGSATGGRDASLGAPGAVGVAALLKMLLAAAAPAAPGEVPAWAKNTWTHPASFRSGIRSIAPAKPIAEQTTADRIELYLASIGRTPTPKVWP
jgi:hypothetical protein